MTEVVLNLRGWADSLDKQKNTVKFVLQVALFKTTGNCDWEIKVKDSGGCFVYDQWDFNVVAKRVHSLHYQKGKKDQRFYTTRRFKFKAAYSQPKIYEAAIKELAKCSAS